QLPDPARRHARRREAGGAPRQLRHLPSLALARLAALDPRAAVMWWPPAMRRSRKRARRRLPVTLLLGIVCAVVTTLPVRSSLQPSAWQQVYARREGEIGKRTATGFVITPDAMFVALPHRVALGKHVEVRYRQRAIVVPVLDVGPWNIDDEYWATNRRPAAE